MLYDKYVQNWGLSDLSRLNETPRCRLFKGRKADSDVVLKVYTGEIGYEQRSEVEFLRATKGYGTVDLIESCEAALLLEFCDGPSLQEVVTAGGDDVSTRILSECIKRLHRCPIPKQHSFMPLDKRFRPLKDFVNNSEKTEDTDLFIKSVEIAGFLCSTQKHSVLLHGDVHHENIIYHKEKGWLLIDPKGFVGDPVYDVANFFLNPWERPEIVRRRQRILEQSRLIVLNTGFDQQRILNFAFVQACLSQAWFLETGESSDHARAMMKFLAPLAKVQ